MHQYPALLFRGAIPLASNCIETHRARKTLVSWVRSPWTIESSARTASWLLSTRARWTSTLGAPSGSRRTHRINTTGREWWARHGGSISRALPWTVCGAPISRTRERCSTVVSSIRPSCAWLTTRIRRPQSTGAGSASTSLRITCDWEHSEAERPQRYSGNPRVSVVPQWKGRMPLQRACRAPVVPWHACPHLVRRGAHRTRQAR